eukprot:2468062-Prymnesium_polylepis.1
MARPLGSMGCASVNVMQRLNKSNRGRKTHVNVMQVQFNRACERKRRRRDPGASGCASAGDRGSSRGGA